MSVRMRRSSRPAPRSCVRMLFPGTVERPRFLPPFRVLSPRHRRYDVDHTSSRCEGQVLRRGVLLGGAVQGRAGGVISERVDQVVEAVDTVDTADTAAAGGELTGFVPFRVGAWPTRNPAAPPRLRRGGRTRAYGRPARPVPDPAPFAGGRRAPSSRPGAGSSGKGAHGRARRVAGILASGGRARWRFRNRVDLA